jgi:hypothetical protein
MSKMEIVKIAATYKKIKSDPQLITMGPLFTVMAGRFMQLIERAEKNDTPDRIQAFSEAWANFNLAVPGLKSFIKGDKDALKAYNKLNAIIESNFHDYMAWNEIRGLVDEMRKLNDSYYKQLKDMGALLSVVDMMETAGMLLAAVSDEIDDPNKLEAIAIRFADILGDNPARGVDEGGATVIDAGSCDLDRGQVLYPGDEGRPSSAGENTSHPVPAGLSERSAEEG